MINKEVRALLPAWAACAVAILTSRWEQEPFRYLGVPVYLMGTAGLGAWAMGHEYTYGTLTALLSLPVPRRRVWAIKLIVLAAMLAALAILASFSVSVDRGDLELGAALFVLPAVAALFLASWLTVATRSPLAGAVFTISALGGTLAASDWIGDWLYGFTNAVDAFRVAFVWWTLGGLSAVAAVLGWRTFATLEVHEGHGAEVELPITPRRTAVAAAVTRRHWLVALIVKELRVQQLAIVIAVLWALAYSISELSGVRQLPIDSTGAPNTAAALLQGFYSLVLPALIGSLACAEERHLGTLDGQLLLPMRSSTQWIVKSATAFGLAVVLAVVLPLVLAKTFGDHLLITGPHDIMLPALIIVLTVTSISLYISTVAQSGLRALMGSIAATFMFGFVVTRGPTLRVLLIANVRRPAPTYYLRMLMANLPTLAALALVLLIAALALPNFRYVSRRPMLIATHAALVIACVFAYSVALSVLMALTF